jgi:broad specificity phosphatase PhoE
MRIYFLRHEDRYKSTAFFTPLTFKGKKNALKLANRLASLKITQIFSSPFLRTLQTIEPFVKKSKLKVNLENSIREINLVNHIPKKECKMTLPEELEKQFNINKKYDSFLKPKDIIYPEEESYLKKRFNNFLKYLIEKYNKTDDNILIVSHAGLIEGFIRKLQSKNKNFSYLKKIRPYNYPLGKITMIVEDNRLVFKPENWEIV